MSCFILANKNVVFTVDQSYEGTQKTSKNLDSFRFHCIKSFGPVLKVEVQVMVSVIMNPQQHRKISMNVSLFHGRPIIHQVIV